MPKMKKTACPSYNHRSPSCTCLGLGGSGEGHSHKSKDSPKLDSTKTLYTMSSAHTSFQNTSWYHSTMWRWRWVSWEADAKTIWSTRSLLVKMKGRGSQIFTGRRQVEHLWQEDARKQVWKSGAQQDVDLAVSTCPTRWSRANAAHWRTPTLTLNGQAPTACFSVPVKQNMKTKAFPKGVHGQLTASP